MLLVTLSALLLIKLSTQSSNSTTSQPVNRRASTLTASPTNLPSGKDCLLTHHPETKWLLQCKAVYLIFRCHQNNRHKCTITLKTRALSSGTLSLTITPFLALTRNKSSSLNKSRGKSPKFLTKFWMLLPFKTTFTLTLLTGLPIIILLSASQAAFTFGLLSAAK